MSSWGCVSAGNADTLAISLVQKKCSFHFYIRVDIRTCDSALTETRILKSVNGFLLQNLFAMLLTGLGARMEINKEGRQRSPAVCDTQLDLYNSHLLGQHVQTEWHIWHTDGTAAKLWCNWCTTVAQCGPAASGDTFPRQRAASLGLAGGSWKEPSAIMLRPYVG